MSFTALQAAVSSGGGVVVGQEDHAVVVVAEGEKVEIVATTPITICMIGPRVLKYLARDALAALVAGPAVREALGALGCGRILGFRLGGLGGRGDRLVEVEGIRIPALGARRIARLLVPALPSLVSPGWSCCSSITIDAVDEVAAIFGLRALVGAAFDFVEPAQPGVVGVTLRARLDELVLIGLFKASLERSVLDREGHRGWREDLIGPTRYKGGCETQADGGGLCSSGERGRSRGAEQESDDDLHVLHVWPARKRRRRRSGSRRSTSLETINVVAEIRRRNRERARPSRSGGAPRRARAAAGM